LTAKGHGETSGLFVFDLNQEVCGQLAQHGAVMITGAA
jgi:hypothetical protein